MIQGCPKCVKKWILGVFIDQNVISKGNTLKMSSFTSLTIMHTRCKKCLLEYFYGQELGAPIISNHVGVESAVRKVDIVVKILSHSCHENFAAKG